MTGLFPKQMCLLNQPKQGLLTFSLSVPNVLYWYSMMVRSHIKGTMYMTCQGASKCKDLNFQSWRHAFFSLHILEVHLEEGLFSYPFLHCLRCQGKKDKPLLRPFNKANLNKNTANKQHQVKKNKQHYQAKTKKKYIKPYY